MMSISKSYLMMAISIVIITNFIYFQPQSYTSQLKFFEANGVPERSGAEAEAMHIVYNEAAAAFAKVVNEAEAMLKVYKEAAVASGKAEADAKAAAKRAEAAAAKAKAEGTTPAAAKAKVEADGKVIAKRAEEDAAAKTKAEAEGTAAVKRVEEEAAAQMPPSTSSCQLPQNITSEYEVYRHVHEAKFPACMAGQWIYEPSQAFVSSPEYLQCLDQELQGNCHDPSSWEKTDFKPAKSRHNLMLKNAVQNSQGILNGSDPWAWQSNLSNYKVVAYNNHEHEQYRKRISTILSNRTIYLVGDSLTRQWGQTMRCEIMHILGKSNELADKIVLNLPMHVGFSEGLIKKRYGDPFRINATERDYVIFNFGHHVGKKLGDDWPTKYTKILNDALAMDFGDIPDHHIFFRTTTVRHFLANQGDWNTNSSKAGGLAPNMQATWNTYGGNLPELPDQNLIAFNVLLHDSMHNNSRRCKKIHHP